MKFLKMTVTSCGLFKNHNLTSYYNYIFSINNLLIKNYIPKTQFDTFFI